MTARTGAPPTVHSLHVLAEHVLGAGLYAATGHIGLQVDLGGVATPASAVDALGGRAALAGGEVVRVGTDGTETRRPITSVADAARFLEVEPGMPASVYTPATAFDPDAILPIDRGVADQVGRWFALADEALARFAAAHLDDEPTGRTLWPEHFDLSLSAAEINYGASPGDDEHVEPYLYVGPWTARTGPFWTEPFGASAPASAITTVDDALRFFEHGRAEAQQPSPR